MLFVSSQQVTFEVLVVECIGITVVAEQHAAVQVSLLLCDEVIACTDLATVADSSSSTATAPAALWMQPLRVQLDRLQLVRYNASNINIVYFHVHVCSRCCLRGFERTQLFVASVHIRRCHRASNHCSFNDYSVLGYILTLLHNQ
jgi:hypothetical protein